MDLAKEEEFSVKWGNCDPRNSFAVFEDGDVTTIYAVRNSDGDFFKAKKYSTYTVYSTQFTNIINLDTVVTNAITNKKKYANNEGLRVSFSKSEGTYLGTTSLIITSDNATTIRYTIDGADVTDTSTEYNEAINISVNTVIKAKAYNTEWIESSEYIRNMNITATVDSITTPVDGSITILKETNIVITFDKNIDINTFGTVTFATPGIIFEDDINCQMNILGSVLTINPNENLSEMTRYENINIKNFKDLDGVEMLNYSDLDYDFYVRDNTNPVVIEITPTTDLNQITKDRNIIIMTNENLDEAVIGTITLNGMTYQNGINAVISIATNTITLNPDADFISGENVDNISISDFKDENGNSLIYENIGYNFTIIDTILPTVLSYLPADEEIISEDQNIKIVFSESMDGNVFGTLAFTTPAITFINASNCEMSYTKTTYQNDTLIINPNIDLTNNIEYSNITISGFKDLTSNTMNSLNITDYNVTIVDITKPIINSIVPADNTAGITINSNIEIIFNGNMDNTTYGKVTLKSPEVTFINGVNCSMSISDATITINPSSDLLEETTYNGIIIENFKNINGSEMLKYENSDYDFATSNDINPEVNFIFPVNLSKNVSKESSFLITFDSVLDTNTLGSISFSSPNITFDNDNSAIAFLTKEKTNDTIKITPNGYLIGYATYSEITISGFKDIDGRVMNDNINNDYNIIIESYDMD